jgi:hypothetical protein
VVPFPDMKWDTNYDFMYDEEGGAEILRHAQVMLNKSLPYRPQ